jgi:transposase
MKPPLRIRELTTNEISELDRLYRETKDVRLKQRAQIILLAAENKLIAPEIAQVVRVNDQSVRSWLRRYMAQGIAGLRDEARSGAPRKVTAAYEQRLLEVVRQRPRTLGQSFSTWTVQRVADFLKQELGVELSKATVHRVLQRHDIVFSRPQHSITSPDSEYMVKKRRLKGSEQS